VSEKTVRERNENISGADAPHRPQKPGAGPHSNGIGLGGGDADDFDNRFRIQGRDVLLRGYRTPKETPPATAQPPTGRLTDGHRRRRQDIRALKVAATVNWCCRIWMPKPVTASLRDSSCNTAHCLLIRMTLSVTVGRVVGGTRMQ
jgi:hypothetical protein